MELNQLKDFYKGRRVFVTGHTGFKGSWLCQILSDMGAEVYGYSLRPESPSLFEISGVDKKVTSCFADIRDLKTLTKFFNEANPEIVLHLAAQPLVRESYEAPAYTYETNVMGTVNIMECVRQSSTVKSFLNVTTDKVYLNREWEWGYREIERLDGYDPYSNSKSCSELVTWTYHRSFFISPDAPAISTARAGNVIGGGDFAKDRIIPDCVRAALKGEDIIVRNPNSTRPYQHVLEPLFAYLMIAAKQYENKELAGAYNVGPDDEDCYTTGNLVDTFVKCWGGNLKWINQNPGGPHEANFLKLDNSKIKAVFGWHPTWRLGDAMRKIVEWTKTYAEGKSVSEVMNSQIEEFIKDSEK